MVMSSLIRTAAAAAPEGVLHLKGCFSLHPEGVQAGVLREGRCRDATPLASSARSAGCQAV